MKEQSLEQYRIDTLHGVIELQRRRIQELENIISNLEIQATFCDMGDGVIGWKTWAHIPKEEWDANMELWKKYVASR